MNVNMDMDIEIEIDILLSLLRLYDEPIRLITCIYFASSEAP